MRFFNVFKTLSVANADVIENTANEAVQGGMKFAFDAEKCWKALTWLGEGMVGIFLVTGVIILSVMLLNKFTSPKNKQ